MASDTELAIITSFVTVGMRQARNLSFDAAAELCDELARTGGCAACCAAAIRALRDRCNASVGDAPIFDKPAEPPPKPSEVN